MKKVIAFGLVFAPMVTFAIANVNDIFTFLLNLLNSATVLIMAAAVVYFLYGVFKFVSSKGDAEAQKEGRDKIVSGLIGLAVMGSVYGLVNILTSTANLTGTRIAPPDLPTLTK